MSLALYRMAVLLGSFSLFPAHAGVILINGKNTTQKQLFPAHAGVILMYSKHFAEVKTFPRTRRGDPESAVFFHDKWLAVLVHEFGSIVESVCNA